MKPTNDLLARISALLAADTASLGATPANVFLPIIVPFTPGPNLALTDLTATYPSGIASLAGVAGTQLESVDPVNGDLIVEMKPPAGGIRWETPGGFTATMTVYGVAVISSDFAHLWGAQALDAPITLTLPNQAVTIDSIKLRIPVASLI